MKAVTVHLEESVYREFQDVARSKNCTTAHLIREAMENYRQRLGENRAPLWAADQPASVGKVLQPWTGRADFTEDVFDRS